jgi:hypothetical protein
VADDEADRSAGYSATGQSLSSGLTGSVFWIARQLAEGSSSNAEVEVRRKDPKRRPRNLTGTTEVRQPLSGGSG